MNRLACFTYAPRYQGSISSEKRSRQKMYKLTLLSQNERREKNQYSSSTFGKSKNQKDRFLVRNCVAPLTLYSSNGQVNPERDRKMRGQLLWCLRISLRIAESPYKQLRNFANSRHCLRRMRYGKKKKRREAAEKVASFVSTLKSQHGRFFPAAATAAAEIKLIDCGSELCCGASCRLWELDESTLPR
jgi:hypothetical protein